MGHIVELDNAYIICSKGNKLNTFLEKVVDVAQKLRHYVTNGEGKYEYCTALYMDGYAIQSTRQLPLSMHHAMVYYVLDIYQQQTTYKANAIG